jgi:DNA (cytosine-5)-methyltransferase 1
VVVENVPTYLKAPECLHVVDELKARGFAVRTGVVNCADYGVPQRRLRALVSAARFGLPVPWPETTHGPGSRAGRGHRTVADAFALLPVDPDGRNWHRPYEDSPERLRRYRSIPEGGARGDLPGDLKFPCWRSDTGYSDVMGRLQWDRPSTTIRTEFFRADKGRYLHPRADRPITPREAARLQSFPDSFVFPEGHTLHSIGRQIGNAIPPLAAEALGRAIARALSLPLPKGIMEIEAGRRDDSDTSDRRVA